MEQTYTLTRTFDAEGTRPHTFTVTDTDTVNCAHMLAAGFNTLSRNFMHTYVLAVVDTEDGRVFYDGKIELIKRAEPRVYEQPFRFELSEGDADTILTLFGNGETPTFTAAGKMTVDEKSKYAHISRDVLEAAYAELEDVKDVLSDAGVETIPATAGVQTLTGRLEHERHARQNMETQYVQANESARAELIEHVQCAYAKWGAVDPGRQREGMKAHLRGMIEVLSTFLAATGEADRDERHAVALRVCGIPEGNYLYVD